MTTLDELGLKFGTDKASDGHGYCTTYERVFGHRRHEPINLLELGVYKGASLQMWDEYFDNPDSDILGIDINPPAHWLEGVSGRVRVYRGDQAEIPPALQDGYAPDLVIDDASHLPDKTIASFECWWPVLAPGGIYIVEDISATYDHGGPHSSFVEYIQKLADETHYHMLRSAAMEFFKGLTHHTNAWKLPPPTQGVEWIFFAADLVIVKKVEGAA